MTAQLQLCSDPLPAPLGIGWNSDLHLRTGIVIRVSLYSLLLLLSASCTLLPSLREPVVSSQACDNSSQREVFRSFEILTAIEPSSGGDPRPCRPVARRMPPDPAGTAVVDSTVQQLDGSNPPLDSQRSELALLEEKLMVLTTRLDELDLQLQHSRQQELHWQEQFRAAQSETRQLRDEVSLSQRAVLELRADFEQQQRTDVATFDQLLELVRGLGPIAELVERTPESR